jgi:DNA-binding MarR family transcriptional regulator
MDKVKIEEKIVFGIEKLARANRVLLWEVAKKESLSPIQIQFLNYVNNHPRELCTIKNLSNEFDLAEATVSEAIKSLQKKGFIYKKRTKEDGRVYILLLTEQGEELAKRVSHWSSALVKNIKKLSPEKKEKIMLYIMELLKSLQKTGVISVAKMCLNCENFEKDAHPDSKKPHHCCFTNSPMSDSELTIDCKKQTC